MDKENESAGQSNDHPVGERDGQTDKEQSGRSAAPTDTSKAAKKPTKKARERSGKSGILGNVLLLALFAVVIAGGVFGWQWWQQRDLNSVNQGLTAALAQQQLQLDGLTEQLRRETQTLSQLSAEQIARNDSLEARLSNQEKLSQGISVSGREDWVLAEAEFLLRLAQQRLLSERQPAGALALLESSDEIFSEINDAKLFPVRKALAREVTALRLAGTIDREGIYLQLVALGEAIARLQTVPILTDSSFPEAAAPAPEQSARAEQKTQDSTSNTIESTALEPTAPQPRATWFRQLLSNARQALHRFAAGYLTIRTLDRPMTLMLSEDQELLLNHSLRLAIEQAELALLREEQVVYVASLDKAEQWLRAYYQASPGVEVLIGELQALKAREVVQALPDISESLEELKRYLSARDARRSAVDRNAAP